MIGESLFGSIDRNPDVIWEEELRFKEILFGTGENRTPLKLRKEGKEREILKQQEAIVTEEMNPRSLHFEGFCG